jgi:uncharacterized repeat protein (TIGR01451 family)
VLTTALVSVGTAQAGTITVTTTGDPGPAGTTSLRQAVAAAGDGDTVSLPAGHITLALGEIVVTKAITVSGAGAGATTVDANGASRVFEVTSAGTVTFSGLTITRGALNVGSTNVDGGAGVFDNSGALTFTGVALTSNAVTGGGGGASLQGGGAIFSNAGALTVTSSTLSGNSVTLNGSSTNNGGGAIFNNGAGVTLTKSTLSANSVTVGGAATLSNNGGGAIYDNGGGTKVTGGSMTANAASISGGTSNNGGGAFYENGSESEFSATSVSDNAATIVTGKTNDGGGAIYNNGGVFKLSSSTVASNSATLTGTEGFNGGGGIYNNGLAPIFVNVTISDNTLSAPTGSEVGGGGLYQNGSAGMVTNATLTANHSNQPGGGYFGDAKLTFKSTIVAANGASSGHANCDGPEAAESAGNNLEDTAPTTCSFTGPGDLVGVPANLGPLANNGGPGPTHALLAGSLAIDHIPLEHCTDQQLSPQQVTTDERGVRRGLDGACDVGAYEFAPSDLALTASASATSIALGGQTTLTFSVSDSGPAPATNAALNITIPAGLAVVSASSSQGSCSASTSGESCSLGFLEVGGSARVTVVVRGTAVGSRTVGATLSASEPDPTPADNTRSLVISVSGPGPGALLPKLTGLSLSPDAFRAASGGPTARPARRRHRPPVGTRLRYRLNLAASVLFTVEQALPGRRLGHQCRAPSRGSRGHHRRCTRYVALGGFTVSGSAGANSLRFSGRLGGHKLTPGTYRLLATPSAGGRTGRQATASFRIVK